MFLFPLITSLTLNAAKSFVFLAISNANLKSGGSLNWKKRLVKNARLLLLHIELIKIVRLTSLLPGMLRLSSPTTKLRHGRRPALLSYPKLTLNLCTLFCVLSLAFLPYLPPLLTFPTVPLPGSWLRSSSTIRDPTFLSPSQRLCVA